MSSKVIPGNSLVFQMACGCIGLYHQDETRDNPIWIECETHRETAPPTDAALALMEQATADMGRKT
ncbi:MAG: hypothetical protein Q8R28_05245 [Dehalococcoidia bacterium]|nr:hypothetical protein [Dehalococcoidia bacterium]